MNCCGGLLKVMTFVTLLIGLILAGAGCFVAFNMYAFTEYVEASMTYLVVGVIILGFIVALVGFIGCFGTCTGNVRMLQVFTFVMVITILAQGVALVLGVVYKGQVRDVAALAMNNTMQNFGQPDSKATTTIFDALQSDLYCCGIESYKDWKFSPFSIGTDVPMSCCHTEFDGCGADALTQKPKYEIFRTGCLNVLEELVDTNTFVLSITVIVLIVLQILTTVLSCVVWKTVKSDNYFV